MQHNNRNQSKYQNNDQWDNEDKLDINTGFYGDGSENQAGYGHNEDYTDSNAYINDDEELQENKDHIRRDKIKSKKNKRIFRIVWWAMVILVGLSLGGYLIQGSNDFFAVGREQEQTAQIVIPENVTVDELATILQKGGVIKQPDFFKLYCSKTTKIDYFTAGTYTVKTNMDYEAIINYLEAGTATEKTVEVVFQEGMNILEIAQKLEDNNVCKAADVLEAAKSNEFDNYDMISQITNTSDKYYKIEGYLFPDTYTFAEGESVDSVLGKMLYNYQTKITSNMLEKINSSGYTMDQIVTMASIIQAEAADTTDMYMISAILHNRLSNGEDVDIYTLDCDSTRYYPYRTKSDVPSDMGDYLSNYDTYTIKGLPAGAICNPGIDALRAAISPSSEGEGYYYFCHSADGTAYYAKTEAEHEENLVKAGLA
jgi:UPF0755 protein